MILPPIVYGGDGTLYVRQLEDRCETLQILLSEQRKVSEEQREVIAAVLRLKADDGG